ncbi:hypothetical protein A3767_01390 [Oleiphilus sp. HI0133]|nr:hypothetical protein A3767_01390 [Oleiphilus sp. HI0133]
MTNNKKWVFESLVDDDQDNVGLIAYALYKCEKHNLAQELRASGHTEEQIVRELESFHSHAVAPDRLRAYEERAEAYFGAIWLSIEEALNKDKENALRAIKHNHEQQLTKIRKEHAATLKKEKASMWSKLRNYTDQKRPKNERFWSWLTSGLANAVGSLLILTLIFGGLFWLVPDETRFEIFQNAVAEIMGLEVPRAESSAPSM